MKNSKVDVGALERIFVRGIQGILSDAMLETLEDSDIMDIYEVKHMAEQVYFQMKGKGL